MEVNDQPAARQILNFVLSKPPGPVAIFVLSDGVHLVQGFTKTGTCWRTRDPKSPRSHLPRVFLYADNSALLSVPRVLIGLRNMSELPGRRTSSGFQDRFVVPVTFEHEVAVSAENFYKDIKEATDAMAGDDCVYPLTVTES